jgi:hypothetical protein
MGWGAVAGGGGANGVIGTDRTLARGQGTARDLRAVITDRGEIVLVWSSVSRERNAVAQIAASHPVCGASCTRSAGSAATRPPCRRSPH